jgi:prostaglandin-E synthase 1
VIRIAQIGKILGSGTIEKARNGLSCFARNLESRKARIDMELTQNPVFIVFAVCAAVLCLKMLAVGHFTGITRIRRGVYLNPEDAQAFSKKEEFANVEHPDVERGLRAHRNDLESTLPFLAIGLVYVLVSPPVLLAQVLLIAFTVLRCAFSLFYLRALQPWRSASFLLGELCLVIMLVQILWWGLLG